MTSESAASIVSMFVMRARRVAAHSLARNREQLGELAKMKLSGQVALDGTVTVRRKLPDEEIFESLAARVRPLTLRSEPIHFEKVLKSLLELLEGSSRPADDPLNRRLVHLSSEWARIDLQSTQPLAFWLQTDRNNDGSVLSPQVADIQLAASWMYADLVHSNPQGQKREGMLFPVKERYAAAVSVFSRIAVLCLSTHDLIVELHAARLIDLDPLCLETEVVVGVQELVDEGQAYMGPAESLPPLDAGRSFAQEGWEEFTATALLRQNPRDQVEVLLSAPDGSLVASYSSAVSKRTHIEDVLHWTVLLAGVVTAEFAIHADGTTITDVQLVSWTVEATTNRMKLAFMQLQREMGKSSKATFFVGSASLMSFGISAMDPEHLAQMDVSIDTPVDLTKIEAIIGKRLATLKGPYSLHDRVRLRQARLLLEGNVVPLEMGPMPVTAPRGVVPDHLRTAQATFLVGEETAVVMPAMVLRHPLMRAGSVTENASDDEPQDLLMMEIPVAEPFVAWIPELVNVNTDEELRHPARLRLSHVSEKDIFSTQWDGSISETPSVEDSGNH